jgi:hypothetical protein
MASIISFFIVGIWLGYNLNSANGLEVFEDQYSICDNVNEKCVIVDVDDFFNSTQDDTLKTMFKYDLDTFGIKYLVGGSN